MARGFRRGRRAPRPALPGGRPRFKGIDPGYSPERPVPSVDTDPNPPRQTGARGRPGGSRRRHGRGRPRGNPRQFLGLHTGRQAGAIANAEAGAEYNPEIRNLREEAKGSRARQRDLGGWYAQLSADYHRAQNAGLAALKSVEDTTTRQLDEAGAADSAELQALAAENAAFSKLTGAPTDTAGLARVAQASSAARRARAEQDALPASEQADYVASLGSRKTAARMQGIEARQAEARRRDKIRSDLTATRREKGAARVANTEKLREADRAYQGELAERRLADQEAALKRLELEQPNPYDVALERQAELGLEGDLASAGAQEAAARQYGGARRRTAAATERAAREGRRGHQASARGQVRAARINANAADSGGYSVREALALAESKGHFRSPRSMFNYLVARGVKAPVARKAVRRATGGQGGRRPTYEDEIRQR